MADDLNHLKRATAILAACIARTLRESDPTAESRLATYLDAAYAKLRDDGGSQHELELLSWTRSLITGYNAVEGQGTPFLDD